MNDLIQLRKHKYVAFDWLSLSHTIFCITSAFFSKCMNNFNIYIRRLLFECAVYGINRLNTQMGARIKLMMFVCRLSGIIARKCSASWKEISQRFWDIAKFLQEYYKKYDRKRYDCEMVSVVPISFLMQSFGNGGMKGDLTKLTLKLIKFSRWKYDYNLWWWLHGNMQKKALNLFHASNWNEYLFHLDERETSIFPPCKMLYFELLDCFITRLMM